MRFIREWWRREGVHVLICGVSSTLGFLLVDMFGWLALGWPHSLCGAAWRVLADWGPRLWYAGGGELLLWLLVSAGVYAYCRELRDRARNRRELWEWHKRWQAELRRLRTQCLIDMLREQEPPTKYGLDLLTDFYREWHAVFGSNTVKSLEVANWLRDCRNSLPDSLSPVINRLKSGNLSIRTGKILRNFNNQVAGAWRLIAERDSHDKVQRWRVVSVNDAEKQKGTE